MRTIKYKKENFDVTKDAAEILKEIEIELGIKLSNDNPNSPNEVQGYLNTSSEGAVEIYFYEQADIDFIDSLPEFNIEEIEIERNGKMVKEKRKYRIKENVPRKKCILPDNFLIERCNNYFLNKKGLKLIN